MTTITQKRFQNTHLSSLSSSLRKNFLSLSILFIAFFWGQFATAQNTPLIGPANGGNFQLGAANTNNTWPANGWTTDSNGNSRGTATFSLFRSYKITCFF